MEIKNIWIYRPIHVGGCESWETSHTVFGPVILTVVEIGEQDSWYLTCSTEHNSFHLKINASPIPTDVDLVLYRADNILHQLSVLL